MLYGNIVTGAAAAEVLGAAGIGPDDIVGDFFSFNYNGSVYWILQREMYFSPTDAVIDGWHIVYAPSIEEQRGGGPGPGFFDNIEAAMQAIADALKRGAQTTAGLVPIVLIGAAAIGLMFLYNQSKRRTA